MTTARVTQSLEPMPDYATQLGHLVVASAHLEFTVLRLLTGVMDASKATRTMYYATANFRGKVDLVKRVARARLDQPKAERICDLLERVYKSYKKRNRYVHNVWGTISAPGKPPEVILGTYDPEQTPPNVAGSYDSVKLNDLKNSTNQLKRWNQIVMNVRVEMFGRPSF